MSDYIPTPLRQQVYERAGGQCEYCLVLENAVFMPHEIDHIIAQKHDGATNADNLALACTLCNKHKGSDLASIDSETGIITPLYHPRNNNWRDHFRLEGAKIVPLTPIGRVTVRLLQLNRADRLAERELWLAAGAIQIPEE